MTNQIDTLIRRVHRAVGESVSADRTDGQLLTSFIEQREEAAFGSLVHRHGPMVWGVCRRVVGHHHDAEDAFQATFLILARKASSVRPRAGLANWLYGVALRTSKKARGTAAKRRVREKQVPEVPEPEAPQHEQWPEQYPALTRELSGLPENYRLPIQLCDLEGKAIKEAARQLGWPQGTVAGRLARGRKLLGELLVKRGVIPAAGALAVAASQNGASAGVPTAIVDSTIKIATTLINERSTIAGAVPPAIVALMEGAMKNPMLSRLSKAVGLSVILCAVAFGSGLLTDGTAADQPTKGGQGGDKPPAAQPPPVKLGNGAKPNAPKTDLDRLQGAWRVVSIVQGGVKLVRPEETVFMVDDKRVCMQGADAEIFGGLYLDPTSDPKTYDLAASAQTIEGIYSLDGDTLRLRYDHGREAKRPTSFKTEKDKDNQILLTLKRIGDLERFGNRLEDGTKVFPILVGPEKIGGQEVPLPLATPRLPRDK